MTLAAWGINTAEFRDELVKSGIRLAVFAPIHKKMSTDCPLTTETIRRLQLLTATSAIAAVLIWRMNMPILSSVLDTWKDTALRLEW